MVDLVPIKVRLERDDSTLEPDEVLKLEEKTKEVVDDSYLQRIAEALQFLEDGKDTYLSKEGLKTYSPKFLHIWKMF